MVADTLRFARTPWRNVATVCVTLSPILALVVTSLFLPDLPTWVKGLAVALLAIGLLQIWKLRGNWDLWAEIGPTWFSYGRGATKRTFPIDRIVGLYTLEPRRYRLEMKDGTVETVDLRVLYHMGQTMDVLLARAISAHWMDTKAGDLRTTATHTFGPIAVRLGSDPHITVGEFQVPLADADLVLGNLFVTVGNTAGGQSRLIARHTIPNLHTLAMLLAAAKDRLPFPG